MEETNKEHWTLYSDKAMKDYLAVYLMKGLPDAFATTDDASTAVELVLAALAKRMDSIDREVIEGIGEFSKGDQGIVFKPDPGFHGMIE